jgi:hypothetical protein
MPKAQQQKHTDGMLRAGHRRDIAIYRPIPKSPAVGDLEIVGSD